MLCPLPPVTGTPARSEEGKNEAVPGDSKVGELLGQGAGAASLASPPAQGLRSIPEEGGLVRAGGMGPRKRVLHTTDERAVETLARPGQGTRRWVPRLERALAEGAGTGGKPLSQAGLRQELSGCAK